MPGRGRDRAEPRAADGRPRGAPARRQGPVQPDGRPARRRGSARVRRPRHREGARPLARGAGGGDRRHRRDRRQRADRADRRDDRAAQGRVGPGVGGRRGRHRGQRLRPLQLGPRPHPGGPAATRARARVLDRREHRPPRFSPARPTPRLGWLFPGRLIERAGAADQGVRRSRRQARRRARAGSRAATSRRSCWPARSTATRRS